MQSTVLSVGPVLKLVVNYSTVQYVALGTLIICILKGQYPENCMVTYCFRPRKCSANWFHIFAMLFSKATNFQNGVVTIEILTQTAVS